ncbi:hypothetical protein ACFL29_02475, partial [Patescibacteria group bacterium]
MKNTYLKILLFVLAAALLVVVNPVLAGNSKDAPEVDSSLVCEEGDKKCEQMLKKCHKHPDK